MSEDKFKLRQKRAVKAAIKSLNRPSSSCKVIILDGNVFHLEAIRAKEIRKIRIVLDEITDKDIKIVKEFRLPEVCTKEIWCKKLNRADFSIREIQ